MLACTRKDPDMPNVIPPEPGVNPGPGRTRARLVLPVLALLILMVSTACSQPTGGTGRHETTYLILGVTAFGVAIIIINALGRVLKDAFAYIAPVLKLLASLGFALALVAAAVAVAVIGMTAA
jgi:hypothetical protein